MPGAAPNPQQDLDVAELAARLKASRAEFEAAFDAIAMARQQEALAFKAIALRRQRQNPIAAGAQRDAADMRAALERAKAGGFLAELCATAGDRLFNAAQAGTILPALLAPDEKSRKSVELTFQAIASSGGFRKLDEVQAGLMQAQRRTCRIVVRLGGDRVTGSGFLIGPRLVLTNWHVVQSLLEPLPAGDAGRQGLADAEAWRKREGSADALSVQFDLNAPGGHTTIQVAPDWLIAASRSEGGSTGPTVAWPTSNVKAAFEPFDDFAILKLSEAAGLERGYYDIAGDEPPPRPDEKMVLVQYPGSFSIRMTDGSFAVASKFAGLLGSGDDVTDARVLHNANSIGGSSGGLILDPEMRPVALHQAGIQLGRSALAGKPDTAAADEEKGSAVNVAIPLYRIWKKARAAIQGSLGDLRALRPLLRNGDPLIGRMELQQAIAEAMAGKAKIIVVRPSIGDDGQLFAKVGKSFSRDVLRDYLDGAGHVVTEISAAKLVGNAFSSATAILEAVRGGLAADLRGSPSDPQSSELNDVVASLSAALREKLVADAGNRVRWIVIDDLETHSLPHVSTRDLLDRFYADVMREPALRLMLVGLLDPGLPSLQNPQATRFEKPLVHLDREQIGAWLASRLDGRLALPDAVRHCIAGTVESVAESRKNPLFSKTRAVVELIKKDVDPPLKRGLAT